MNTPPSDSHVTLLAILDHARIGFFNVSAPILTPCKHSKCIHGLSILPSGTPPDWVSGNPQTSSCIAIIRSATSAGTTHKLSMTHLLRRSLPCQGSRVSARPRSQRRLHSQFGPRNRAEWRPLPAPKAAPFAAPVLLWASNHTSPAQSSCSRTGCCCSERRSHAKA